MNGYFKTTDRHIKKLAGYRLPPDWWSRPWEYAWAIQLAKPGQVVADMGCGWMYRPFKDALAKICEHVYAVDVDARLLEQERGENVSFVVANFERRVEAIEDGSLDGVFCISVLEDLGDRAGAALREFGRCIKDSGFVALTFDMPYDENKPTPAYPSMPLAKFEQAVRESGMRLIGRTSYDKESAVRHDAWNLCCFHCVLEKN